MKKSSMVLAGLTISFLLYTCAADEDDGSSSNPIESSREQVIASTLSYLNENDPYDAKKKLLPELQWIDIENNNVYLGFSRPPSDVDWIVRGAALKCNLAIDFGCHVWAVDARDRPFVAGKGRYYQEATARNGKVQ